MQSKQLKPAVLKMFTDVTESSKNLQACFFFSHTRDKTIKKTFFISLLNLKFTFFSSSINMQNCSFRDNWTLY